MTEVVVMLLGTGASVENKGKASRFDALRVAAERGHGSVCSVLVQHGARTDATDDEGRTALIHAVRAGSPSCVSALLSKQRVRAPELEFHDSLGMTALHYAVEKKNDAVRLLLYLYLLIEVAISQYFSGLRFLACSSPQERKY